MDDYGDSDSCWLWGVGGGSSPWHWVLQHARNYLWARGEPEASAHQDCAHPHMDPASGPTSFCLHKKLLMQVFALEVAQVWWRWLGLTVRNGDNLKVLSQEEIIYASGLNCGSLSGPCPLGACSQIFRELIIWKSLFFFSQQAFIEDFLWVRMRERLMSAVSVFPWWSGTLQGGR